MRACGMVKRPDMGLVGRVIKPLGSSDHMTVAKCHEGVPWRKVLWHIALFLLSTELPKELGQTTYLARVLWTSYVCHGPYGI